MTGYRVEDEPVDPLAVDPVLAGEHRARTLMVLHGLVTLVTCGLWLPVVLFVWLTMSGRKREFAESYTVKLGNGRITAGTRDDSRTVPLDTIVDASIRHGMITMTLRAGQPMQIYGMKDPRAASETILNAREEHVQQLGRGRGAASDVLDVSQTREQQNASRRML